MTADLNHTATQHTALPTRTEGLYVNPLHMHRTLMHFALDLWRLHAHTLNLP